MKNQFKELQKAVLFDGILEEEMEAVLQCLCAAIAKYEKNCFILHVGEHIDTVGLVLTGSVHVMKEDFWGNRNLIAKVLPGQLFAEAYACVQGAALAVSVVATQPSKVMFLDMRRLFTVCGSACEFHTRLIRNLLVVIAEKNILMNGKLTHITRRTTREKLLSYLSAEALCAGQPAFDISFNRQQLADYLSIDRSAMSNELCKMRDEGLLTFCKSSFVLLEHPAQGY